MGREAKSALAPNKALSCPDSYSWNSVAELYEKFQVELQGLNIVDPDGRTITFQAKDFPHLVKLEFQDLKQKMWVPASARFVMSALQNGTLDESRYRIRDSSRARTLFWVPGILSNPDSIHPNRRNTKNLVYAKRYTRAGEGATLKIVLVQREPNGLLSVQTSFWSDDSYHRGCVALSKSSAK